MFLVNPKLLTYLSVDSAILNINLKKFRSKPSLLFQTL